MASTLAELLRGGARGVTADLMGGPVDLATLVTNALIAGGGYGAHKLGLIDQPPELLESKNVPLSSDWLAKNTPLEGEGTAYEAGRMLPLGAGALSAALRRATALPRASKIDRQRGALYAGDNRDTAAYHNTNIGADDAAPNLPRELTNPSFGITTNNRKLVDEFGTNYLIPRPQVLEPRTSPTVIKSTDFYTPRRSITVPPRDFTQAEHFKFDDIVYDKWHELGDLEKASDYIAALKEADRAKFSARARWETKELANSLPQGGSASEWVDPEQLIEFLREKRFNPDGTLRMLDPGRHGDLYSQYTRSAPAHRSWKDFDKSKEGAALLRKDYMTFKDLDPVAYLRDLESGKISANSKYWTRELSPRAASAGASDRMQTILQKTGIWFTPELLESYLNPSMLLREAETRKSLSPFGPVQATDISDKLAELNQVVPELRGFYNRGFRYAPTEYGEAKRYGNMPITSENFAGFVDRAGNPDIAKQLRQRGIPYEDASRMHSADVFNLIELMQADALRRSR